MTRPFYGVGCQPTLPLFISQTFILEMLNVINQETHESSHLS